MKVTEPGFKADADDEIRVEGKLLKREEKVVYILNKPKGVISSSSDERGRTTVVDLVDSKYRLYPLGRLDYDSSGLVILSNDGDLTQKMLHPKFNIDKVYEVTVSGLIKDSEIGRLEKGVYIDKYKTAPCEIRLLRTNESYGTNYQKTGKELMSRDELAVMDGTALRRYGQGLVDRRQLFLDRP